MFWRRVPSLFLLALVIVPWSARGQEDPVVARMRADLTYLASDECEGRGVGTKGIDLAADYIARQFAQAGLVPGGVNGSWFQPFTMTRGAPRLAHPGKVALHGPLGQTITLQPNVDFQVMALSGTGKVTAPLVFVGHGITAPDIGYDDYRGIDVAGKIVIVVRKTPRFHNPDVGFDGPRKDEHAPF
ncbi:MAG: hypothetical protein NZO58_06785, partial [Gemmataceae bacterium]|nr:hypothetical protein [Gemmataceae bacterium]